MKTASTVGNMKSTKGNPIPNQFILKTSKGTYFQSYQTIIVFINTKGQVFLDKKYWDYSNTTRRYRNMFLGEMSDNIKAKIKNGTYKLKDLN